MGQSKLSNEDIAKVAAEHGLRVNPNNLREIVDVPRHKQALVNQDLDKLERGETLVPVNQATKEIPRRPSLVRQAVDTVAEFAPVGLSTAMSSFGPLGRLAGYGGGQGIREVLQNATELPGAMRDIFENLRSNDPDVQKATAGGFASGMGEGVTNLLPGGRGARAAITSVREDRPYTAAAQTLGAVLDATGVGYADKLRRLVLSDPRKAAASFGLAIPGSLIGSQVAESAGKGVELTEDQQVLANAVGQLVGGSATGALPFPAGRNVVVPTGAGVGAAGLLTLAGATPLAATTAGLTAAGAAATGMRTAATLSRYLKNQEAATTATAEATAYRRGRDIKKDQTVAEQTQYSRQQKELARKTAAERAAKKDADAAIRIEVQTARYHTEYLRKIKNAETQQARANAIQAYRERIRLDDKLDAKQKAIADQAAYDAAVQQVLEAGAEAGDILLTVETKSALPGAKGRTRQIYGKKDAADPLKGVDVEGPLRTSGDAPAPDDLYVGLAPEAKALYESFDLSKRRGLGMLETAQEVILSPDDYGALLARMKAMGWSPSKIEKAMKDPASLMGFLSAGGTGPMPGSTYAPGGPRNPRK